jgi:HEAT repeat protein
VIAFGLGLLCVLAPPGARRALAAAPVRAAAVARDPAVLEQLVELLAAGTTPARATAALGALAQLADPRSVEAVALYAAHRRPEVRLEAVKALGAILDPRAITPLLDRLGDQSPEVRAAAAQALAARAEPRALPRLMALVKRNDVGAAVALGRLANPDTISQLRERQGAVAEAVVVTVLGAYLKRADVGDGARIDVLRAIGGMHGAEATAALREYLASIPPREDRASKREAQKLLDVREADK